MIDRTDAATLQGFVDEHTSPDADVYTDGSSAYRGRKNHQSVAHSAGEYVRYLDGTAIHTNGVESFWSMLKRAHKGTFHRLSPKHLQRYVNEFAGRHNIRELDTIDQMRTVFVRLSWTLYKVQLRGCTLTYNELITDNGLPNGARG